MKNIKIVLILILLLTLAQTQRGGGRSGGGRSGGGRSGGGRSFSRSGSFRSGSGGYYGYGVSGIIVGSVFGIIGLFVIIFIIYSCCRREEVEQGGQEQQQSNQQRQAMKQQYFNTQKIARNNVCLTNMSEDEFEFYRNYFQTNKWKFYYNQYNQRHDIVHQEILMTKIGPYLYSLNIRGTDELGNWTINGFYLNTVRGIQWWGMKNYDHPDYAGQTQEWDKLMYEGAITRDRNYYGKWYFVGFESNPQYSADWFMQTIRV